MGRAVGRWLVSQNCIKFVALLSMIRKNPAPFTPNPPQFLRHMTPFWFGLGHFQHALFASLFLIREWPLSNPGGPSLAQVWYVTTRQNCFDQLFPMLPSWGIFHSIIPNWRRVLDDFGATERVGDFWVPKKLAFSHYSEWIMLVTSSKIKLYRLENWSNNIKYDIVSNLLELVQIYYVSIAAVLRWPPLTTHDRQAQLVKLCCWYLIYLICLEPGQDKLYCMPVWLSHL